jgi:putative pyruvate formate lyase activating enzyme
VFFGRCTLRCLYCQNYPWSQEGRARPVSVASLAAAFAELREQGCQNWNLVSPTPWLPQIREALRLARRTGAALPVVYNTSGFERPETLREYRELADVYLTDLRYARADSAQAGSGCAAYAAAARRALREMWRLAGPLRRDAGGAAVAGTVCRLLILPGRAAEAVENLRWLAGTVGTGVALSVMAQYVPAYRAPASGAPWNRRITPAEYEQVCEAVGDLGFTEGWIQDFEGQASADLIGFNMAPQVPAAAVGGGAFERS